MAKKYVDAFGDGMKAYESVTDVSLMKRCPVIIRIDGRAFHTLTRNFDKPFDLIFIRTMQLTMKALCENIQGCVFGYVQSDEITLVLCDYQTYTTSAWFDYRLEKVCSLSAAMATKYFNKYLIEVVKQMKKDDPDFDTSKYEKKYFVAEFDSRAFNVPKEDVCNAVLWRQKDCEKNSVQMLARSFFSHKELQGLSTKALQNKMFEEKGVNWNDLPTMCKRGTACVRKEGEREWRIDYGMPILSEDRSYIESRINFEEVRI